MGKKAKSKKRAGTISEKARAARAAVLARCRLDPAWNKRRLAALRAQAKTQAGRAARLKGLRKGRRKWRNDPELKAAIMEACNRGLADYLANPEKKEERDRAREAGKARSRARRYEAGLLCPPEHRVAFHKLRTGGAGRREALDIVLGLANR